MSLLSSADYLSFPSAVEERKKAALENRGLDLWPMGSDLALPISPSLCEYMCVLVYAHRWSWFQKDSNMYQHICVCVCPEVVGLLYKYFERELG